MSAVKVFDEITKVQIASHEIERISFVVIDPRDTRAFGYIYNTSDDRHQFWAIKTERPAAATVLALKELFELAFEQYTNAEKASEEATKVTTPTSPQSPSLTQATSPVAPVSEPVVSNPTVSAPSLLDDAIWGESPAPAVTKPTEPVNSLWDMSEPVVPVAQPPPKAVNPLEDLFGDLSLTTPTQPPAPTVSNSLFFDAFSNTTPTPAQPPPANPYGNFYGQPAQPNFLNTTPNLLQQQQRPSTPTLLPFGQQQRPSTPTSVPFVQQQQQNPLSAPLLSPVAPPSVTSPFAGLDLLGSLSSGAAVKSTKELFNATPPPKTMQQLLMEKQT